jgi:hypothetical protein
MGWKSCNSREVALWRLRQQYTNGWMAGGRVQQRDEMNAEERDEQPREGREAVDG